MLIVIGVALGVTLPKDPTSTPTWSPEALSVMLSGVSSDDGEALRNSSTPQNLAFNWMVMNNTNPKTLSNETIIQRYALATLYYSTNGDIWDESPSWLDNGEECSGWGVTCTETDAVSELDLSYNNLNGTLPPEIGLLTLLGKCVLWKKVGLCILLAPNCLAILVMDCHDALAQSFWACIRIHLV
jgi:hypothetical protein